MTFEDRAIQAKLELRILLDGKDDLAMEIRVAAVLNRDGELRAAYFSSHAALRRAAIAIALMLAQSELAAA